MLRGWADRHTLLAKRGEQMESLQGALRVERTGSARVTMGVRDMLAVACRTLAGEGHCATLAGQVTARLENGNVMAPPLHLAFDEMTAADFIEVTDDFRSLGRGIPNPATRFHLWVYRARGDVGAIVHTHPPAVSALSMLGRPLVVSHMDAAPLYEDCAFLAKWPGVPVADEEGRIISEALGDSRAILLAHHGMLTVGRDIAEALYVALALERAAEMQLRAESVGPIVPIDPALATEAHDFLLQESIVSLTFDTLVRRAHRRWPELVGP
jgi:L-fuculose-phosphate aldolase